MTIIYTPRDYLENIEEEDGFDCLDCSVCGLVFRGWKLKTICRICAIPQFPTDIRHITHVAVIYKNVTYSLSAPDRHHHVLRLIYKKYGDCIHNLQGFLDNNNVYVSRKEALEIALNAKQVKDPDSVRANQLFSEDLW